MLMRCSWIDLVALRERLLRGCVCCLVCLYWRAGKKSLLADDGSSPDRDAELLDGTRSNRLGDAIYRIDSGRVTVGSEEVAAGARVQGVEQWNAVSRDCGLLVC